MTNSATSTESGRSTSGSGFQAWHFFTLLSMVGATVVVIVSRETQPVALLLLSAAAIAAGFVGLAFSRAVAGFFQTGDEPAPLPARSRAELERQKALVLRSIKELEFDKAMGKVSEADFAAIASRLRGRALVLMADLERVPVVKDETGKRFPVAIPGVVRGTCPACGTVNDSDARFCKSCGTKIEGAR
jgi:hypothetical protein